MDKTRIQIRLATLAEASEIATVLDLAFVPFRELYMPDAYSATTPDSEVISKRWAEGPVWVAIRDNNIVGTVAAVPKHEGLYIRSMAVLPTERGKGVGRRLLETVEHFAREQGFGRLFLSTTPFLLAAIRLYENFGFQRAEDVRGGLFGTPLFQMEKKVAA